jgi:hypothetical protein
MRRAVVISLQIIGVGTAHPRVWVSEAAPSGTTGLGAADRGQHRQAAGAITPQSIDDLRHHLEQAARLLKLLQRAPIGLQYAEQLGMDWIGSHELRLVGAVAYPGREVTTVVPVEAEEGLDGLLACLHVRPRTEPRLSPPLK